MRAGDRVDPISAAALPGPALLFCPADRPERFGKAMACADAVIIDLEDAVSPAGKDAARALVKRELPNLDPQRVIIRINQPGSRWWHADLDALKGQRLAAVMVPKTSGAAELEAVAPHRAVAICESAAGVLAAPRVAAARNCIALLWGGEDLIADLGGRRSRDRDGRYHSVVEHARAHVLLGAKAHQRQAIDAVHVAIADLDGLRRETIEAANAGFNAKACIHPSHVGPIRAAFAPQPDELGWALGVIKASELANDGVATYDGQMIDAPLVRQARLIVEAATASAVRTDEEDCR